MKTIILLVFLLLAAMPAGNLRAQTTDRAPGRGIESFPYPFAHMVYLQPRFDRQVYDDGTYFNSYVLRGFSTYWGNMHFRAEVPFANTNTSGTNIFGLSDISVRAVHAHQLHDNLFLGYGAQLVMNTATDPSLGGGKWDIRPGAGLIYFRGDPDNVTGTTMLAVEYRTTLAKEEGRSTTNVLAVSPNIDWWFPKWYVGYYATWSYDFTNKIVDIPIDIEVGYSITPQLTLATEIIVPLVQEVAYTSEFAFKLRYSFLQKKK